MQDVSQALHNLGYPSFRPFQEEIVRDVLARRDVLGLFATGAGKSLCYQLPAVLLEGVTVVVSPLISLMKEQVGTLQKKGIAAASLNSTQTYSETKEITEALIAGDLRILFVSPEKISTKSFFYPDAEGTDQFFCHRRSPLHLDMGTPVQARIPEPLCLEGKVSRDTHHCPYGNRRAGSEKGYY